MFFFLVFLFFFLAFGVYISSSPVYNILFLILCVIDSCFLLFSLNVDFLGLTLIIIYVGAIAVLFLFIIIMLNLKITNNISYAVFPIIFFCIFFVLMHFFLSCKTSFGKIDFLSLKDSLLFLDLFTNVDVIGQIFFSFFLTLFLFSGAVLLIAIFLPISLLLFNNSVANPKITHVQLTRDSSMLNF